MNDPIISKLSAHLFWDINPADLDIERSKRTIIKRVLEYGLWQDWLIIEKKYGLQIITNEVRLLNELDPKSLAFISKLSGVPVKKFKCYTKKLLMPAHWNF